MTSISQLTQPTVSAPQQTGSGTNITADFNTFLTLMTTQMQNQDPLNPMNSTEFATQLATFSGVEQQVRTNEQLGTIIAQNGVTTLGQLSQWVGMEVLTEAPASFSGVPITLYGEAAVTADSAQLVVKDASGQVVQKLAVQIPVEEIDWAGTTTDGHPLPLGNYRFELESLTQNAVIATTKMSHYAVVAEGRQTAAGAKLLLTSGEAVDAASVSGLRRRSL